MSSYSTVYIGTDGWQNDYTINWAQRGYLTGQPQIEPGSNYCLTSRTIFAYMASPPDAGVAAAADPDTP